MIQEIKNELDSVDITINITKSAGKFIVSVLPKPKTDDPAKNLLVPFIVKGEDPVEVEKILTENLVKVMPKISESTNSMNSFLDSVKEMEAKKKENQKSKVSKSKEKTVKSEPVIEKPKNDLFSTVESKPSIKVPEVVKMNEEQIEVFKEQRNSNNNIISI